MAKQISSIPVRHFAYLVSVGLFTDAEIVEWLRTERPAMSGKPEIIPEVLEAIVKLKGGTVTGVIRTAVRELEGLPPIPGDGM